MPRKLDTSKLSQFEPRQPKQQQSELRDQDRPSDVPATVSWPSREPISDGQISIKGPIQTVDRFKLMCKADRRTYADMLNILMDSFEN